MGLYGPFQVGTALLIRWQMHAIDANDNGRLFSQDLAHITQAKVCHPLILIAAHNLSMFVYRDIPIYP